MATHAQLPRGSKRISANKAVARKAPTKKPTAVKPMASATAASAAVVPPRDEDDQSAKASKRKLVRDSFTIPRSEYAAIGELKLRLAKLGRLSKKSEVLRAGIRLLAALSDAALLDALQAVPSIKTGRPNGRSQRQKAAKTVARKSKVVPEARAAH